MRNRRHNVSRAERGSSLAFALLLALLFATLGVAAGPAFVKTGDVLLAAADADARSTSNGAAAPVSQTEGTSSQEDGSVLPGSHQMVTSTDALRAAHHWTASTLDAADDLVSDESADEVAPATDDALVGTPTGTSDTSTPPASGLVVPDDASATGDGDALTSADHTLVATLDCVDGTSYRVELAYDEDAHIPDGAKLSLVELNRKLTERERKNEDNRERPYRTEQFVSAEALEKRDELLDEALELGEHDWRSFTKYLDLSLTYEGKAFVPEAPVSLTIETTAVPKDQSGTVELAWKVEVHNPTDEEPFAYQPLEHENATEDVAGTLGESDGDADEPTSKLTLETSKIGELALACVARELAVEQDVRGYDIYILGDDSLDDLGVSDVELAFDDDGKELLEASRVDVTPSPDYGTTLWLAAEPREGEGRDDSGNASGAFLGYRLVDGALADQLFGDGGTSDPVAFRADEEGFALVWDSGYRQLRLDMGDVSVEGLMPETIEGAVASVDDDYADPQALSPDLVAEADERGVDLAAVAAYDIDLTVEGAPYQPGEENPVVVRVTNLALGEDEAYEVWHVLDDGTIEVLADVAARGNTISFEATDFGTHVVVAANTRQTRTASDGSSYAITVTYGKASGIPAGAELVVKEYAEGRKTYDRYLAASLRELDGEADDVLFARVFDITLVDPKTGETYQPTKDVQVAIELLGEDLDEYEQVDVLHFPRKASGGADVVEADVSGQEVAFATDGFSVFVVLGHAEGDDALVGDGDDDLEPAEEPIDAPDDYEPLSRRMLSLDGSWAYWQVDVNPDAYRINGGAALTLADTFHDGVTGHAHQSIDYASIQVSDESVTYDYASNTGIFVIPDATRVTITYRTRVSAQAGENLTFQGTATLRNADGDILATSTATETHVIYPSASEVAGFGTNHMIRLYVYGENEMQTGIEGARFILIDANKRPLQYTVGDNQGDPVTFVTDASGFANVELHEEEGDVSIERNTVYYLEMIQSPEGWQRDKTLYSFMITDNPSYDAGDGIYTYYNGDTLKVRLYEATPNVRVAVRFTGNYELAQEHQDEVEIVLEKLNDDLASANYGDWEEVERHPNSDAEWGSVTFTTALEVGASYRVSQENERPWDMPETIHLSTTYYCMVGSGSSDQLADPPEFTITSENAGAGVDVVIDNRYEEPDLTITKMDKRTGAKLPGAVFTVFKGKGNEEVATYTTDEHGMVVVSGGEGFVSETLYRIEETQAPAGYLLPLTPEATYFYFCNDSYLIPTILEDLSDDETAINLTETYESLTLDNQKETLSVPVMKTWQDGQWPTDVDNVVIGLYQSVGGADPTQALDEQGHPRTVVLTKDAPYNNRTFDGLPAREGGRTITYSIKEEHVYKADGTDVLANYVQEYGVSDVGVYVVRNRKATTLAVSKVWLDENDQAIEDEAVLASRPEVTFDVYRSTTTIPESVREGGIFNEEMTAFVATLTQVREGVTLGADDGWETTIDDLPEKADSGNRYYYYVLETIPSFGDELYEVDEAAGSVVIRNKLEPTATSLTVQKAALVDDPRDASSNRDFTFTLALNKGNHPIRSYEVASGLTTDWDGEVTFELKPLEEIRLAIPEGITATITEGYDPEYLVAAQSDQTDDLDTSSGRIFQYDASLDEEDVVVTYTNTLHVICKVVDKDGGDHPYESLKSALEYIRTNPGDALVDGVATIQMLEDYDMPATDVFDVQAGESIVLTTATTDEEAPFHFRTERTEDDDVAIITRSAAGGSMLTNEGTLTLDAICLDGANIAVTADGGLINSAGTLNLHEKTTLRNASTTGRGGAIYASGTIDMPGGSITGNSAANGSAIYLAGMLTLTGGSITGNGGAADGAVVLVGEDSKVDLSGNPVISDNTNASGVAANLYFSADSDIVVNVVGEGLGASALIGVTAAEGHREIGEQFATTDYEVTANLNRFVNDLYGYRGKVKDGTSTNVVWNGLTLTVVKEVEPLAANPNDTFTIRVSSNLLKKSTYTIDGALNYTVTAAANNRPGTIVFREVRNGQAISISPLPVGSYTIVEVASNYAPTYAGIDTEVDAPIAMTNGTFALDGNSTVTVTNERRMADVRLTKSLQDRLVGHEALDFPLTVTLTEADGTPIAGLTLAEGVTTGDDGTVTLTMSPTNAQADVRTLRVPVGAAMSISEPQDENYRITTSARTIPAEGEASAIDDEDTDHANVFSFHVTDEGARVTFANARKMAGIELRKELVGKVSESEDFDFDVTLTRDGAPAAGYALYLDEEDPDNDITTDANGRARISFHFGRNESSKSLELAIPDGAGLTVEEAVVKKDVEGTQREIYDTTYAINEGTAQTGTRATIASVSDSDSSIVFSNARKMQTVTLTNTVSGYSGNVVPFPFTVTVTDGTDEAARDYDDHGFENGVQSFELTSGQSKTLTIPYGSTLHITQDFVVGYETTVKRGNASAVTTREAQCVVTKDETFAFSNAQLIKLVLVNETSSELRNVQVYTAYGNRMYRVNEAGTDQTSVPMSNHWATVSVAAHKSAVLLVNHKTGVTDEQEYRVKGTTPAAGYYYTIKNDPSFHEFADPAVWRVYGSAPFEMKGRLRYSVTDSTVTFTEQPLVSFDANGGTWTTEMEGYHDRDGDRRVYQKAVDTGGTVSRPADTSLRYPTAEDIRLLGWTEDETFAKAGHTAAEAQTEAFAAKLFDFEHTEISTPRTLYAIWQKDARDGFVVTLRNATGAALTVGVTLSDATGNPIAGRTIATIGENTVVTDATGQAQVSLAAPTAQDNAPTASLSVPSGARLVLVDASEVSASIVSSEFADADSADRSFTIGSVARDGTVTFGAGICKITDANGHTLRRANGQPAVYSRLSDAFTEYPGIQGATHVKMLVDEYTIQQASALTFPNATLTLTTAGANDEEFPYTGTRDRSTIYRYGGGESGSCFSVSSGSITLENIILDGGSTLGRKAKQSVNGALINVSGGTLSITEGTVLRNSTFASTSEANYDRGGAVYINAGTLNVDAGLFTNCSARRGGAICAEGTATLNVTGTSGSTVFDNCSAVSDDGGAIYYSASKDLVINGGENKKKPGIVFTSCKAASGEGDGGAIYVTESYKYTATIKGCSFTECSARVTGKDSIAGNGGGAIAAYLVKGVSVVGCSFQDCDTLMCGGAVVVKVKKVTTVDDKTVGIVGCAFSGCNCKAQGGAVAVYQDDNTMNNSSNTATQLYIEGSSFANCSSGTSNGSGGAIQCYLPCMEFVGSSFADCWAGKEGGAVNNFFSKNYTDVWPNSSLTVTNCRFERCRAEDRYEPTALQHYGGAINAKAKTVNVSGSYFEDCVSTLKEGGALHIGGQGSGSTATISDSIFRNCAAKNGGGAILSSHATLSVSGSSFYGCSSSASNGGAIYHYRNSRGDSTQNTTTISDCVFSAGTGTEYATELGCNAANNGGAIWTRAATVTIERCTIDGCTADGNGGGIYLAKASSSSSQTATISGATVTEDDETVLYGTITGCEAVRGAAVYVEDQAIFSGVGITGNTCSNATGAAVETANGKLSFEGDVVVQDNPCSADATYMHDVLMQKDGTTVVYTTASSLGGQAYIGIYVPDTYFNKRGTEGKAFGTWVTGGGEYLESFFNDRDDGLYGYRKSDTDMSIYWGRYICKITDASGNTLLRPNGKDAVYQRLSTAIEEFTQVKDSNGQTGQAVYIKMLIETYDIKNEALASNAAIADFPAANITLTTERYRNTTAVEGVYDGKYPYRGQEGSVCTLSRTNGTNALFKLQTSNAGFALEHITLDGRTNKTTTQGNYRLIEATAGNLTIGGGTTLQYGYAERGGAIMTSGTASLLVESTEDGDILFAHCKAHSEKGSMGGGAIYAQNSVTVASSGGTTTFEDCSGRRGGAIMVDINSANVHLSVDGAAFRDCTSGSEGGALYHNNTNNTTSSTIVKNSSFERCTATAGDYSNGGAINAKTAYLTVESCSFKDCHGKANGGAINHGSGVGNRVQTTISDTTFEGCHTTSTSTSGSYGYGGSVYTQAKTLSMTGCSVEGSTATNSGGALYWNNTESGSEATINGSSFADCSANRDGCAGGAIYARGMAITLQNNGRTPTTIDSCSAKGKSGAVYLETANSSLTIKDDTKISGCYANEGGAIYVKANVTMNLQDSAEFTENGYMVQGSTVVNAARGACIYLAENGLLNLSGSPKFSRNNLTNQGRIVNGGITDYVRQDIYLVGYEKVNATSIHVAGELTGDTIWVWPEKPKHQLANYQFATTEEGISSTSLEKFRNALSDDTTGCSHGEYLAGVRLPDQPVTLVFWDKMYDVFFNKIDNKAVRVSGAEFALFTDADCTNRYGSSAISADGETDTDATGELLAKGVVDFPSVQIGTYYMKETTIPESFKASDTTYLVLVGSPSLNPNGANKALWEDGGPLDVPNAATLVERYTMGINKYYGIFALKADGKADLSKNLANPNTGVVNTRSDFEAYFRKNDGLGATLPGAAFTIYTEVLDGDGEPRTYENGYPMLTLWSRDGETYPAPVESADGSGHFRWLNGTTLPKGLVYFRELPIGTYYLLETAYPVRNGDSRRTFYVETDRILQLEVKGLSGFVLKEWQEDGTYVECDKEDGTYVVGNVEAVCKLTDARDDLLYELGRDGKRLLPAIYSTLEEGFEAAQTHTLYYSDGTVAADDDHNPALKLKALKDFTLSDPVTYTSPRSLTFTTAELTAKESDRYVFVTNRTSDTARADISRAYSEGASASDGALITVADGASLTIQNLSLNGQKKHYTGRAIHVVDGSLTIRNNARLHDFRQEAAASGTDGQEVRGGAILLDNGTTLTVDGGTAKSAVFQNNEAASSSSDASASSFGGAIAIGSGCTVEVINAQFVGNVASAAAEGTGIGGALYTESDLALTGAVVGNNLATLGSALYAADGVSATISSVSMTGNRASGEQGGAINVGGGDARLWFVGKNTIFDNTSASNDNEQRNVVLSEDTNEIIRTTEKGLTGGKIGVYAVDGPNGTIYRKHGLPGRPFGTFVLSNDSHLSAFVNDRNLALYGVRNDEDSTDAFIYWANQGAPVAFGKVDGFGNALSGAVFSLYSDAACTQPYDERSATSADGTTTADENGKVLAKGMVLFERLPTGVYYMKETTVPTGYRNANTYIVLVGENALAKEGLDATATGQLAEVSAEAIAAQREAFAKAYADDQNDFDKYAIFLIDATSGKATTTPDIATYGIVNTSTRERRVVLDKVTDAGAPLADAGFEILSVDMSPLDLTDAHLVTSGDNGVFFVGNLPLGTYYVHETAVPDGYAALEGTNDNWYVLTVTEAGVGHLKEADGTLVSRLESESAKPGPAAGDAAEPAAGDTP